MVWSDIIDIEVDITLFYNLGAGTQQAQVVRTALADWGETWRADMQDDYPTDYRAGTNDMAENLGCDVVNGIWDTVAGLTLTHLVNFQGQVILTYLAPNGRQRTKSNSIVPELAHINSEMIAGLYVADAIKTPVMTVVRKWVASACDECVTDAGG